MASILFKILSSPFGEKGKKFFARVVPRGVLSPEDVMQQLLKRGTSFGEADLRGAIFLYEDVVMDLVAEGYHVNTRIFNAKPTIKGSFESAADFFDSSKHTISVSLSKGKIMAKHLEKASAERTVTPKVAPLPMQYKDHNSGLLNKKITPGGMGEIYGAHLNFDPMHEASGIYFIDKETGIETKVAVVGVLEPKKLIFMIPKLGPGTYFIEVRKSYSEAQTMRTGRLSNELINN